LARYAQSFAGKRVDINAQMAAVEVSMDRDWLRYKGSFFFASGDDNPRDGTARGSMPSLIIPISPVGSSASGIAKD